MVAGAVALTSLSLLILLLDVSEHGLRTGPGAFCGLLLLAAAGVLWGGRVGYWFGLLMAAVLGTLFFLALIRRGMGFGSLVALGIGLTPLALLLAAMRRSPRAATGRQPPVDQDPDRAPAGDQSLTPAWPEGWTRPMARGWVTFGFMIAVAIVFIPMGLAIAASGDGADRWAGVSVTLFGLGLAAVVPLLRPASRRGRPRLGMETVDLGHRHERGVRLPYSRLRTASAFIGGGALALAMAATIPGADAFADVPGKTPLWPRIMGAIGIIGFVLVIYGAVRKGIGRRWRILLTPSAVVFAQGQDLTVVPWEAIDEVKAFETTVYARGFAIHEPFVGLLLGDPQAVRMGRLQRALMGISRRLGADISFPVRSLHADPVLLYTAVRYYHLHPEARDDLGSETGLDSLRRAATAERRDLARA